jgi:hypothetical protein
MTRNNRMIQEEIHDPYFVKEKHRSRATCAKCGVVQHDGVFEWLKPVSEKTEKMICPACRRIDDAYAGGIVVLEGPFLARHRDDATNLIKNIEESEKGRRPLERIMNIATDEGKIEIKTTYEHLARRIGEAVHRAFKGELTFLYSTDEKFVRVRWHRD